MVNLVEDCFEVFVGRLLAKDGERLEHWHAAAEERRELGIDGGHHLPADTEICAWGGGGFGGFDFDGKERAAGEDAEDFTLGGRGERAAHLLAGGVAGDIGVVGHGNNVE
jgi:hypothetical protein